MASISPSRPLPSFSVAIRRDLIRNSVVIASAPIAAVSPKSRPTGPKTARPLLPPSPRQGRSFTESTIPDRRYTAQPRRVPGSSTPSRFTPTPGPGDASTTGGSTCTSRSPRIAEVSGSKISSYRTPRYVYPTPMPGRPASSVVSPSSSTRGSVAAISYSAARSSGEAYVSRRRSPITTNISWSVGGSALDARSSMYERSASTSVGSFERSSKCNPPAGNVSSQCVPPRVSLMRPEPSGPIHVSRTTSSSTQPSQSQDSQAAPVLVYTYWLGSIACLGCFAATTAALRSVSAAADVSRPPGRSAGAASATTSATPTAPEAIAHVRRRRTVRLRPDCRGDIASISAVRAVAPACASAGGTSARKRSISFISSMGGSPFRSGDDVVLNQVLPGIADEFADAPPRAVQT